MADIQTASNETKSVAPVQKKSRLFNFGLALLVIAIGAVAGWAYKEIQTAEQKLEENLALRAGLIVDGRVDAISNQLKNMHSAATRLIESEVFRFFAAEVDNLEDDVSAIVAPPKGVLADSGDTASKLAEQLPLMVVNLRDFSQTEGFVSGRIVNRKSETYISTLATPPPLTPEQQEMIKKVLASGEALISPITTSPLGLVHELVLPIFPPSFEVHTNKPVSVLILVKAVTGTNSLSELVSGSSILSEGFITHLIQQTPEGFQEIGLSSSTLLHKIQKPATIGDTVLPFGKRLGIDGQNAVYSMGRNIPGTPWWLIQERDFLSSRDEYNTTVRNIISLAVLASLALMLLLSVFWWRFISQQEKEVAYQFKDLYTLLNQQKQLLDGINSTINDPISLTNEKGVYQYVNLAFAEAVGRQPQEVVGLDTSAIFGFDTAKRLGLTDQRILETGESATIDETIWLLSKRHFFQIAKAPLRNEDGTISGIVSVFRDITMRVEAQERGSRMVQQTINALVRAIEASDPFLGGHSRIMGSIATQIAKAMHLSEKDVATIEAAASLSQIGKMFVPREVLTKPGALTETEKRVMEQHVEFLREVLKDIEFELPVMESIYQMNERLDGQGYPQKLSGDQICINARVLAVANAFAAMARPRSYRPALPVNTVLEILHKESAAFDNTVVVALEAALKTPIGEKIVSQAATSVAV